MKVITIAEAARQKSCAKTSIVNAGHRGKLNLVKAGSRNIGVHVDKTFKRWQAVGRWGKRAKP